MSEKTSQNQKIDCAVYYGLLQKCGLSFFTGVPDSLLKDICGFIADHAPMANNIVAANEGAAVALAAGYHLATGKTGMVYLQNSGLGNAVNPLTSLTDPEVYSIPLLLLVGWRGEPGTKDEPQHIKQGKVTLPILDVLTIPYEVHPLTIEDSEPCLTRAIDYMEKKKAPFALVVRKGTFAEYKRKEESSSPYELNREAAIVSILEELDENAVIVSTTGMTSREVFEFRSRNKQGHNRDFLTVGSMGHASQIALTIAKFRPGRQIYCIDGDGAFIMHMGSAGIVANQQAQNFKHIVINNGSHDSVGGQPTVGFSIDIPAIARACGYEMGLKCDTATGLKHAIQELKQCSGSALLEVRVKRGVRANLGRPTQSPLENKTGFVKNLRND